MWTLSLDIPWSASLYEISVSQNPLPEILPCNVAVELAQDSQQVWPLSKRSRAQNACAHEESAEALPASARASSSDVLQDVERIDGEHSSEDSDVIVETYPLRAAWDDVVDPEPWHLSDEERPDLVEAEGLLLGVTSLLVTVAKLQITLCRS